MKPAESIAETLRGNLSLYEEVWQIVAAESEELRENPGRPLMRHGLSKKALLPRLVQSLDPLASSRDAWQATPASERARHPEVDVLVRKSQDLLMKIIFLDRENEQTLLRQGLLPARDLPSVNRQRPHFIADLYRRQGAA